MSLYYDAAAIISSAVNQGSLRSRVYAPDSTARSNPASVYALILETSKSNAFLKEVVDNAQLLAQEPKVRRRPSFDPRRVDCPLD